MKLCDIIDFKNITIEFYKLALVHRLIFSGSISALFLKSYLNKCTLRLVRGFGDDSGILTDHFEQG